MVVKVGKEWQIDRLKCCICNLCVEVCPVKSLSTDNHYAPVVTAKENAIHQERLIASSPGEETGTTKDPR